MSNGNLADRGERALGRFGLFLMVVVAVLARRGYEPRSTPGGTLGSALARRAIDAIAVVGWLADRLPEPRHARAGRARPHRSFRVRPA